MNTSKTKKKEPFAPVEILLNWFDEQTLSHRIQVALYVIGSTPSLYEIQYDDPESHFREWLKAPIQRNIELLARLGTVKTLIDVCFGIPFASNDAQAFCDANVALKVAMHKAKGDATGEELWASIQKNRPVFLDSDENFFISWRDLFDKEGPLSDRSLYQWLFDESGRHNPLLD